MKFSKETQAVLANFSQINGGIVLKEGNHVMTRNQVMSIYAESTLTDNIDADFALYDLKGFLKLLTLTEDPDVELQNGELIAIKTPKSVMYFPSAQESVVVSPKAPVKFPTACVIFDMSAEDYKQIQEFAQALNADIISFASKDSKIYANGYNKSIDNLLESPVFTIELVDYDGEYDFNFFLKKENLKLLQDAYKVMIWGDGARGAVKFEGSLANYIISPEKQTSHNFSK